MTRAVPILLALLSLACASPDDADAQARSSCEWCGVGGAPADVTWTTRIAGPDEPGEPLVLDGTVYAPDGTTPVPGVVLYFYHTNAEGIYPRRGDETGNGRRHGYLRGWVRTDADGRYRVTTIRPAAYPGRTEPAHIHIVVGEPGRDEYWVDEVVFDDDPLLTPAYRARLENTGGSGVVSLTRDAEDVWRGRRDLVLVRD